MECILILKCDKCKKPFLNEGNFGTSQYFSNIVTHGRSLSYNDTVKGYICEQCQIATTEFIKKRAEELEAFKKGA